jgi:FkbM family methyltransferase
VEFPLDENSVVLDIGGYKGRWSKEIAQRYPGTRIFVFEPQMWAAKIATAELQEFSNVHIMEFGLGVESGKFEMEEFETDGASFVLGRSQRQQSGEGVLQDIAHWLYENNVPEIDLIMMNIEGYEFKLIPYMLEKGILQKVKYFMCQFHPHGYEQEEEYEVLRKRIGEVMDVHFDYGIVLMCWKQKTDAEKIANAAGKAFVEGLAIGFADGLKGGLIELVPAVEDAGEIVGKPKRIVRKGGGGRKKKASE